MLIIWFFIFLRLDEFSIAILVGSCGVAKERMESKDEMHCYDWFFCTKKLAKELILEKILKK